MVNHMPSLKFLSPLSTNIWKVTHNVENGAFWVITGHLREFILVFHSNYVPVLHRFWDVAKYLSKFIIIIIIIRRLYPYPPVFRSPLGWSHLNFTKIYTIRKLHCVPKKSRKSNQIFSGFHIPKIIKIGQFLRVIQKIKWWTDFFGNSVESLHCAALFAWFYV